MQGYTDPGVRRRAQELDALERVADADSRRRALGMTRTEFRRFEADELDKAHEALNRGTAAAGVARAARAATRAAMAGGYEARPQQRPPAATRY